MNDITSAAERRIHPAIQEELEMLRERFPGKVELTLDEYAAYFGISRLYAAEHFRNMNMGRNKIQYKRFGKVIIIPLIDFAYWLACHKIGLDGRLLVLPTYEDTKKAMNLNSQTFRYRISQLITNILESSVRLRNNNLVVVNFAF